MTKIETICSIVVSIRAKFRRNNNVVCFRITYPSKVCSAASEEQSVMRLNPSSSGENYRSAREVLKKSGKLRSQFPRRTHKQRTSRNVAKE
jgi:hypothetical protein